MQLSPSQISIIESIIDESDLTLNTLKDDVSDHLCCAVEEGMESGKCFNVALGEALYQLAPEGLGEIQVETDYLLNSNIIPMKKFMYSIGLATSMSITMGLMMKFLHMPGGEELINYGFLGFALLFMPMMTVARYKAGAIKLSHEKIKMAFAILSAVFTGLAVLFKMIVELDFATFMLMAGASVFAFGFLPLHFFVMYKKSVAS